MALPDPSVEDCVRDLLTGFQHYDQTVDIISGLETVFTRSDTNVPASVLHFERFPRITLEDGTTILTPDFSIAFTDNTAIIGEVARAGRQQESVDNLCLQLSRYDALHAVPVNGGLIDVEHVDVMLMLPSDVAVRVIHEILDDRLGDADHPYSPSRPPFVTQFGPHVNGGYVVQRLMHTSNGSLTEEGREGIGSWLERDSINLQPRHFMPLKVERPFVNDQCDALYLAVHLWTKLFPQFVTADERPAPIVVSAGDVAAALQGEGTPIRTHEARRALELLTRAQLAFESENGSWVVGWEELRRREGERRLEVLLARRVCRPPRTGLRARLARARQTPPPPTLRLFQP